MRHVTAPIERAEHDAGLVRPITEWLPRSNSGSGGRRKSCRCDDAFFHYACCLEALDGRVSAHRADHSCRDSTGHNPTKPGDDAHCFGGRRSGPKERNCFHRHICRRPQDRFFEPGIHFLIPAPAAARPNRECRNATDQRGNTD